MVEKTAKPDLKKANVEKKPAAKQSTPQKIIKTDRPTLNLSAFDVLKYPRGTEKAIRKMDSENKLVFVVNPKSTKSEIKKAIESMFGAKVESVNTVNTIYGEKRAYIKFKPEFKAIDIATNLGMM